MKQMTASEVKNKLGDMFDAVERSQDATYVIYRNSRPVAMVLNAEVAEKAILGAYAQGVLTRAVAMKQLGMDWYGDLLVRMNELGISRPKASSEDMKTMLGCAHELLGQAGPLVLAHESAQPAPLRKERVKP